MTVTLYLRSCYANMYLGIIPTLTMHGAGMPETPTKKRNSVSSQKYINIDKATGNMPCYSNRVFKPPVTPQNVSHRPAFFLCAVGQAFLPESQDTIASPTQDSS